MNIVEMKVMELLAEYNRIDISNIKTSSEFLFDLGMDSIERMDALVLFEKEFKIVISDNEAGDIKSVGQVVKLIESKL